MASGKSNIRLVGIGGCGSTVIEDLLLEEEWNADCVVLTSDHQTFRTSSANHVIKFDVRIFDPEHQNTESFQSKSELDELTLQIRQVLRGAEVIVITAGMGTGTSSQLGILVAKVAEELGSLVIAFVTTPFVFEGELRHRQALEAIDQLQPIAHATVVLSNRRLIHSLGPMARMTDAFNACTSVVKDAFCGIKSMVDQNGLINLDLADLRAAMDKKGLAVVGRGEAKGEDKSETAILRAITTPLLANIELTSAQTLIVLLQVGEDFSVGDIQGIGAMLNGIFGPQADILVGVTLDKQLFNFVIATIMAVGIPPQPLKEAKPKPLKVAWRQRE